MNLRILDFNSRNHSIQGLNVLLLSFSVLFLKKTSECKLITLFLLCNANRNILFNELNQQKSLPFNCKFSVRPHKKCCLKDKFIRKLHRVSNTNFVFIFFDKFRTCNTKFFSTNVYQLKNRLKKKNQKFENIFDLVCCTKNLRKAYYEIKNKPNNLNLQNSRTRISTELESNWLSKISNKLNFKACKQKYKKSFHINNKKYLAIENLSEKIIQLVIFQILQQIYEGTSIWEQVEYTVFIKFNDLSWAGNLKRVRLEKNKKIYEIKKWILKPTFDYNFLGCSYTHSVYPTLEMIKKTWLPVTWLWSINLVEFFDEINSNILICKIEKKINDFRFMRKFREILLSNTRKFNKYPHVFKDNTFLFLLLNIFLLPLDNYIYKLKNKSNKKSTSYFRFYETNSVKFDIKNSSSNTIPNQITKIYYVRYATNILFGFSMAKLLAKTFVNKIQNFIRSDLKCKEWSTKLNLTHGISKSVTFSNFKISLYPSKYKYKPQYLVKFYKFKANLQKKKINESKKYLKMQNQILSRLYEKSSNSFTIKDDILKKKIKVNPVTVHWVRTKIIRSLRNSLINMEAEQWFNFELSKEKKVNLSNVLELSEQKNLSIFKSVIQKWVKHAQGIANKENSHELKTASELHFSINFVKARERYFKELKIISSKNFGTKIMKSIIKNTVVDKNKKKSIQKMNFNYHSIRILFPKKDFIKKLRVLNLIRKTNVSFVNFKFLIFLKDQDIINWYTFKSRCIRSYYKCSDNIRDVKKFLNWILWYSLLSTLARKHKFSIRKCIQKYSIYPNFHHFYKLDKQIKQILLVQYPTFKWINNKNKILNVHSLTLLKLERIFRL